MKAGEMVGAIGYWKKCGPIDVDGHNAVAQGLPVMVATYRDFNSGTEQMSIRDGSVFVGDTLLCAVADVVQVVIRMNKQRKTP